MNNITEKKLVFLGFEKQEERDEFDHVVLYYYYTLYIKDFCLISNSNDECINDKWTVELCEYPKVGKFRNINKLYDFIKILKSLRK
jgi:hypothetical protein